LPAASVAPSADRSTAPVALMKCRHSSRTRAPAIGVVAFVTNPARHVSQYTDPSTKKSPTRFAPTAAAITSTIITTDDNPAAAIINYVY
jgi:hypothetical protein